MYVSVKDRGNDSLLHDCSHVECDSEMPHPNLDLMAITFEITLFSGFQSMPHS